MSEVVIASNVSQRVDAFSSVATYTTSAIIHTNTSTQYLEIDLVHNGSGTQNFELQIVSPLNVVYTIFAGAGMTAPTIVNSSGTFPGSGLESGVLYSSANKIEKLRVPPLYYIAYVTNGTGGANRLIYITGTMISNSP